MLIVWFKTYKFIFLLQNFSFQLKLGSKASITIELLKLSITLNKWLKLKHENIMEDARIRKKGRSRKTEMSKYLQLLSSKYFCIIILWLLKSGITMLIHKNRRYRIRHWIPMFIGTPCIITNTCLRMEGYLKLRL